jgi:hypothetical protein
MSHPLVWIGLLRAPRLPHVGPDPASSRADHFSAGSPSAGPSGSAVPPEVYQDAQAILDSALRGDRDGVVDRFEAALNRGGVRSAYDVACCLAATMVGEQAPAGFAALEFPDIERARYDARWVARFVSAYANADASTGRALFGAAMADGLLAECLTTLAGSTIATLRQRSLGT